MCSSVRGIIVVMFTCTITESEMDRIRKFEGVKLTELNQEKLAFNAVTAEINEQYDYYKSEEVKMNNIHQVGVLHM